MTVAAVGLVLLSGVCHAAWNLLLKSSRDGGRIAWWLMAIVGAVLLPFTVAQPLPRDILGIAVLSGLAEAVYFVLIAFAYQRAHFSIVYPVSRGVAPLLTALLALWLARERLSMQGMLGIAAIVAGVVLITAPASEQRVRWRDLRFALAIAFFIAAYSTLDAIAVRRAPLAPYLGVVFAVAALASLPLVARSGAEGSVVRPLRETPWRVVMVIALAALSYFCALAAFRMAPVAYVAAAREVSIPIGIIAGARWFGEPMRARAVGGAFAVVAGLAILALS